MTIFHDALQQMGLVEDPPAEPFMILVNATTSAQLTPVEQEIQAAGATVTDVQPLAMLSSGTPIVQQTIIAAENVIGLFSADVASVIAALLSAGAEGSSLIAFLTGLTPTAPPAQALYGDEDFSGDLTGADGDGNPVVDLPVQT